MLFLPSFQTTLNLDKMRKSHIVFSLFFLSFLLTSCAKKMSFERSTVVPGADGKVAVKKDNNDNYKITINTVNLPASKNLIPAKEVYVVWMEDHARTSGGYGKSARKFYRSLFVKYNLCYFKFFMLYCLYICCIRKN